MDDTLSFSMPKGPGPLELAARFVAALYAETGGRSGRFRLISDCARRAGISKYVDIDRAVTTAEAAGFLVCSVDEPRVMLTEKGREAARRR